MQLIPVFLFFSIFLSVNCLGLTDVLKATQECLQEMNLGTNELNNLERALMLNLSVSDNEKCLISCAAKKTGFVQNGKINEKFSIDTGSSVASIDFEPCRTLTGDDECDTSYKFAQCSVTQFLKKEGKLG